MIILILILNIKYLRYILQNLIENGRSIKESLIFLTFITLMTSNNFDYYSGRGFFKSILLIDKKYNIYILYS